VDGSGSVSYPVTKCDTISAEITSSVNTMLSQKSKKFVLHIT
jgi:hypothetical protein